MTPDLDLATPGEVLDALSARRRSPRPALAGYQPPHAGYAALRDKLAEMREARAPCAQRAAVPDGRPLRIGMRTRACR